MASNESIVKQKYADGREDLRAKLSRYNELEFYYTKRHISEYINPDWSVIELGCGAGHYALYYHDKCKEYVGVDITPENIDILNDKVKASGIRNVAGRIGDATKLDFLADDSFDVALCLGPMYHLPPDERELVFDECRRICKSGGIAAFAYINRVGVYAGACVDDKLREFYPSDTANERVLQESRDDINPELFFYTMPEEIEAVAAAHGFKKIKNIGVDFFLTASVINSVDDEKFEKWKPLLDEMSAYESCTGMSNHALLITRKI